MVQQWPRLKREIEVLRRELLPDPFDPLGLYPKHGRVQLRTRAFLLLSHAEIETFLEERAKHLAKACENLWNKSRRITGPLAFLIGTVGERVPQATKLTTGAKDSHGRLTDVVSALFSDYYKRIKDNHGIKETNVLHLFDPLGIPAAAYGTTMLPNLESLGAIRGVHAHTSARAVTSVLDPETEYKRINMILADLQAFDRWLVRYRRTVR